MAAFPLRVALAAIEMEQPALARAAPIAVGMVVLIAGSLRHCSYSCAGLMAILLVVGVMDLRPMAVVAAAIAVERLAPAGERIARLIGGVVVGAGVVLLTRAAGLG